MGNKLKVNLFAEKFIGEANGVTTAFLEAVEHLKKHPEVEIMINGREPYDILHAHTIGLGFLFKSFRKKAKTLVSAHVVPDSFIGSLIFSRLWQPLAKWYLRFIYSRASIVIAVSPTVKTELEKIGVKARIAVLCNSVDRAKFKPDESLKQAIRQKLQLTSDKKVVLCVGQIQPRKGVEDFIKTAEMVPEATFIWAGGRPYGHLTEEFHHMTELVDNAPANVKFVGIVPYEEMPAYYAAADIYFMPSYQENFAFATIEAASAKLPLVTRDNPEYIDTLLGHYLKADNATGFADNIKKLLTDSTFFDNYQAHADQLANLYEIKQYTNNLVELYKSLLQ